MDNNPSGTRTKLGCTYDVAGHVLTMTDYGDHNTVYTYTATGQQHAGVCL